MLEQNPIIAERFADLHPPFTAQAAVLEAARCLHCFDAPCTGACPTHIDVPRFIKKIGSGNLTGSALAILDANVLGESCARVCPVDVLCEGACVMHPHGQPPIAIGRLQRFAMDAFHAAGGRLPLKSQVVRAGKVACIGAGPASLACAAELAQRGVSVTIYDRRPAPGGLNTYGVAEYKLPAHASLREIDLIRDLGVEFHYGAEIGADSLPGLERDYDRIFIGIGLGPVRRLGLAGEDHPNVLDALDFIAAYKAAKTTSVAGNVVVIGGGNTAIDAANAARRLGAENVSIVYRRNRADMSAFEFEYEHARREGVDFLWHTVPAEFHFTGPAPDSASGSALGSALGSAPGSALGSVLGSALGSLTCLRVDEALRPVPGSAFDLPCDLVILAIGQSPLLTLLSAIPGLDLRQDLRQGLIAADPATGRTANPRYYAGGDCVNGGREVVDAVAEGKRAAIAIAQDLGAAHLEAAGKVLHG